MTQKHGINNKNNNNNNNKMKMRERDKKLTVSFILKGEVFKVFFFFCYRFNFCLDCCITQKKKCLFYALTFLLSFFVCYIKA